MMTPESPTRAPLTPLQQGMLYSWLQDPAAGVDVEQLVCTLEENVDASRLRAAWETLIAAHPVLRSYFDTASAEPAQLVADAVETPWSEEDWSALPAEAREEKLAIFLEADRVRGFDLAAAPLLRFTLLRFGPENFRLIWTFHHILLDGRAITALVKEAFTHYDDTAPASAGRTGVPPVPHGVPPGAITPADPLVPSTTGPRTATFADHARWLQSVDHSPSADFWKTRLAGVSGPTPLIVDGLAGTDATRCQDECDLFLTEQETDTLRAFAQENSVTLNTLVQGAWAILLGRYSGEDRVVFGATRACRHTPVPGSRDIAGLLINTLPVRVDIPDSAPLVPWLQTLRQHWLDMRPHEHTPLSFIRRACGMSAAQVPFQHLLVFENDDYTGTLRAAGGPEWSARSFHLRELTSVPLTLAVYGSARLRLHCAFQPAKFDRATIQRLLGHMAELLKNMAGAAPDTSPRNLAMLPAAERLFLIHDTQPAQPSAPLPSLESETLHGLFAEAARRFPNRIAVTAEDATWTYAELDRRSNAIARALVARGVKPGDFVGICMDRRAPLIAALLGILKAGGAYLPIDLAYPPERLAFMLEDAAAPVLLTEKTLAEKIPGRADCVLFVEDIPEPDDITGAPLDTTAHTADQLAYIIYTSGSTGLPKGCQITHRNVVRLMRRTEHWYGFDEADVWTLFHSTAFDFSVWELWGALLYGGRLVVVPWLITRSPDEFFKLLCEERVTVLNQTPSAFRQLIQAEPLARAANPGLPAQSLRYVIFGGEALEMQSLKPWFDRHGDTAPRLVNMYGITETTVHVTYRPLSADDLTSGSVIGVPIPDLQLLILDPVTREPVPVGVPGEMYVGGEGLAVGYLRRPELTADRFFPNHLTAGGRLYKTGDLARFIPSAAAADSLDIEYLGRIDHQVKIRGFRIELGEIENVLTAHPLVHEAAVIAREDRPGDKRLCAYLVTGPDKPTPDELRALLKTRVPDYMVPAAYVILDKFPITTNGKLDRKALPAPAADGPATARAFVAPATPAEQSLTEIWAAVLRLDRVSAADNFFEIGGDSILSIQVIARAREAGLALTPRLLFENPTVAALAAVAKPIVKAAAIDDDPAAPFPLTPIQRWFFEQNLTDSHHWNQAFLFTLSERIEPAALRSALAQVIAHHSALRLRFRQENGAWIPRIAPVENADILTVHHDGLAHLEPACDTAQRSLDYQNGPLLRAVYFDAGEDRPGRLFLAVHHLAIDGVSWRILLEDLEAALTGKPLPPATASWPQWARQINAWPQSPEARAQAAFWNGAPPTPAAPVTREADAFTRTATLSEAATADLLQRVPAAWRTRINDVLLTALALAHNKVTGELVLSLNLEGHGREEAVSGGLALDRSIGWFTAIFPVSLTIPGVTPEAALPAIKEQLRAIPDHGAGFLPLAQSAENRKLKTENSVFNYLGQLDSLTTDLFAFAEESTPPWHAPAATRAHALEINAVVIRGRLEAAFTAAAPAHTADEIERLANAFLESLQEIIDHCLTLTAPRATPSDFPLAALDQSALNRLLTDHPGLPDICRLSPMQRLFHNAALTKPNAGFDQWTCRVTGPLDSAALRSAWSAVVQRHTILRSTFHSAGLPHAVMITHDGIAPEWTEIHVDGPEAVIRFLAEDTARINDLTKPLCGRFTLLRLSETDRVFVWSVPDLQLDGWSWPLVFAEAAALYRGLTAGNSDTPPLPHPRPYRDYLAWLDRQPEHASDEFWRDSLRGVTAPTPVPFDTLPGPRASRRTLEARAVLAGTDFTAVTEAARRSGVTTGVLAQAAWAALLAHCAGVSDVVHGSAFSGRPADLPAADRIVGPFVNNLPVRVNAAADLTGAELLRQVHGTLTDLAAHQFTALPQVQDCSAVPWRFRLFDSLVVFQNYQIDASLTTLGPATTLGDFDGPIHTNYPLTLVITPRADTWELLLVHQESACSSARAAALLEDFTTLLLKLAREPAAPLSTLQSACRLPAGVSPAPAAAARPDTAPAAPRNAMEQRLAVIWKRAFGLEEIGVHDNFFDLGGHSLLMLRVHGAICQVIGRSLPVVALFQYPTIAALAVFLEPAPGPSSAGVPLSAPSALKSQTASRAAAARAAAARAAAVRTR